MISNEIPLFRNKEKKYFILGLLPFIVVFIVIVIYSSIVRDKEFKEDLLMEKFEYKVIRVFNDRSNHGSSTIETNKEEKIRNIYSAIKNDSIVKKQNDSIVYIYRKDSIIKMNLLQMYRETGWIE